MSASNTGIMSSPISSQKLYYETLNPKFENADQGLANISFYTHDTQGKVVELYNTMIIIYRKKEYTQETLTLKKRVKNFFVGASQSLITEQYGTDYRYSKVEFNDAQKAAKDLFTKYVNATQKK